MKRFLATTVLLLSAIVNAEIPILSMKGSYNNFAPDYRHLSPLLGAWCDHELIIKSLYEVGDPETATVQLIKQLFHVHPSDQKMRCTNKKKNVATYFTEDNVGSIIGGLTCISERNNSEEKINLFKKQINSSDKYETHPSFMHYFIDNLSIDIGTKIDKKTFRNRLKKLMIMICDAYLETQKDLKTPIPSYFLHTHQIILSTFLYKKLKKADQLPSYYSQIKKNLGDSVVHWDEGDTQYTEKQLITRTYAFDFGNQFEESACALLNSGIPTIPQLDFSARTQYLHDNKLYTFSDCVEIALLNLINRLIFDHENNIFDTKRLPKSSIQKIFDFYTKYPTPTDMKKNEQKTANDWAIVVSDLEGITYKQDACEIKAQGIKHSLLVLSKLFGDHIIDFLSPNQDESSIDIDKSITNIFNLFSKSDTQFTYKPIWSTKDQYGAIKIFLNGVQVMLWTLQDGHDDIDYTRPEMIFYNAENLINNKNIDKISIEHILLACKVDSALLSRRLRSIHAPIPQSITLLCMSAHIKQKDDVLTFIEAICHNFSDALSTSDFFLHHITSPSTSTELKLAWIECATRQQHWEKNKKNMVINFLTQLSEKETKQLDKEAQFNLNLIVNNQALTTSIENYIATKNKPGIPLFLLRWLNRSALLDLFYQSTHGTIPSKTVVSSDAYKEAKRIILEDLASDDYLTYIKQDILSKNKTAIFTILTNEELSPIIDKLLNDDVPEALKVLSFLKLYMNKDQKNLYQKKMQPSQ